MGIQFHRIVLYTYINIIYILIDRQEGIYLLWELSHVTMEAEKYHDLLSASRRPREANSVIHSKSEGLRNRNRDEGNVKTRG
jgi:hypothetical protein